MGCFCSFCKSPKVAQNHLSEIVDGDRDLNYSVDIEPKLNNETSYTASSITCTQSTTLHTKSESKQKYALTLPPISDKFRIEAQTSMDDQYYLDDIKDFLDDNDVNMNLDQIMRHLLTDQFNKYECEIIDKFKERIKLLLKNEMHRQYVCTDCFLYMCNMFVCIQPGLGKSVNDDTYDIKEQWVPFELIFDLNHVDITKSQTSRNTFNEQYSTPRQTHTQSAPMPSIAQKVMNKLSYLGNFGKKKDAPKLQMVPNRSSNASISTITTSHSDTVPVPQNETMFNTDAAFIDCNQIHSKMDEILSTKIFDIRSRISTENSVSFDSDKVSEGINQARADRRERIHSEQRQTKNEVIFIDSSYNLPGIDENKSADDDTESPQDNDIDDNDIEDCCLGSFENILTKCKPLQRIETVLAIYNYMIEERAWGQIKISDALRDYNYDFKDYDHAQFFDDFLHVKKCHIDPDHLIAMKLFRHLQSEHRCKNMHNVQDCIAFQRHYRQRKHLGLQNSYICPEEDFYADEVKEIALQQDCDKIHYYFLQFSS